MFNLAVVFLCILLCCAVSVKADSKTDGYSGEVEALFKNLTKYRNNVAIAKAKMKSFASEAWDRKYAIAIINLYTQGSSFYLTLNAEMRQGYPNDTYGVWRRAGDLINMGLDIIGPTIHDRVYRGCKHIDKPPVEGEDFLFNQIISTSTSRATAIAFMSCPKGKLFVISNVYGVSVENISHYSSEREVIIKSTNVFRVEKVSGPVNGTKYSTFYLDGQPDVNSIHATSTVVPETNGVNKPSARNTSKYAFIVGVILIFFL